MTQAKESLATTPKTNTRPPDDKKLLKKLLKDPRTYISPTTYYIHKLPDNLIKWMISQETLGNALMQFMQSEVFSNLQKKNYIAPYTQPSKDLLNSLLHDLNKLKNSCNCAQKSTLALVTSKSKRNSQNLQLLNSYKTFARNILSRTIRKFPLLSKEAKHIEQLISQNRPTLEGNSDLLSLHGQMSTLADKIKPQLSVNPESHPFLKELKYSLNILEPLVQGRIKILQESLLQAELFFQRTYEIALNLLQGFILTFSEPTLANNEKKSRQKIFENSVSTYLKLTQEFFLLSAVYLKILIQAGVHHFIGGHCPHLSFDYADIILKRVPDKEVEIKSFDKSSKDTGTQSAMAYLNAWLSFTNELLKDPSLVTSIHLLKDLHSIKSLPIGDSDKDHKLALLKKRAVDQDALILPEIVLVQLLNQGGQMLTQTDETDYLKNCKDYLDRNKNILKDFVYSGILHNLAEIWQKKESQNSVYVLTDIGKSLVRLISTCQFLCFSYLDFIKKFREKNPDGTDTHLMICRSVLVNDIYRVLQMQKELLAFSKQVLNIIALNEFFFFNDTMSIDYYSVPQRFYQQKNQLYPDESNDPKHMICSIPFKTIDIDPVCRYNFALLSELYKLLFGNTTASMPSADKLTAAVSVILGKNTELAKQFFGQDYTEEFNPAEGILTTPNLNQGLTDTTNYKSVLDQLKEEIASVYHGEVVNEINEFELASIKAQQAFESLNKEEKKKHLTVKKGLVSAHDAYESTEDEIEIPEKKRPDECKQPKNTPPRLADFDQHFYDLYIEAKKSIFQPTLLEHPMAKLMAVINQLEALTKNDNIKTKVYAWMVLGDIYLDRTHQAFLHKAVGTAARITQYEEAETFSEQALAAYKQFIGLALALPFDERENAKTNYAATLQRNHALLKRYQKELKKINNRLNFLEQRKLEIIAIKGEDWYYSPHLTKDKNGNLVEKPDDILTIEAKELRQFKVTCQAMQASQRSHTKYLQLVTKSDKKTTPIILRGSAAEQMKNLGFHAPQKKVLPPAKNSQTSPMRTPSPPL